MSDSRNAAAAVAPRPGEGGALQSAGGTLFALLGGVSAVGYAGATLLVRSDRTTADFLRFFGIFFLLACVWGLALWLAHKVEPARGVVLAGAVLFRLLLLPAGMSLETGEFARQILYADGMVLGYKAAAAVFDLAAVWLLAGVAGEGKRGTAALLAYAWNPLVVKEFAGAGRVEAAGVALMLGAIAVGGVRGGVLLGTAALFNPIALVLAPGLLRRSGWKALAGPAAAAAILLYRMPAVSGARWVVSVLAVAAVLAWRFRVDDGTRESLHGYALWGMGAYLLADPRFVPWQLAWLLPFAALEFSWFWLALSGSVFLRYHARLSFGDIPVLGGLEYAMPLAVWMWIRRRGAPAEVSYNRSCARSYSKS